MSPVPPTRPTVDRTTYALLFLALFVAYSYFNHSDGWSQGIRLAKLHAVVVKGTIKIDASKKPKIWTCFRQIIG